MRGISVSIYRDSDLGDCTNRGVTSPERAAGRRAIVFDEAIEHGNFDLGECMDDPRYICLKIVRRWVGTPREYLHVEPMFEREGGTGPMVGPMFGGNYVATSDSRLRALCPYPLPVHDRFETPEQNSILSS